MAEVKEHLAAGGIDTAGGSPEDFAKFIRDETAKSMPVVKTSDAQVD